ncbi:hypothetical protein BHE97_06400 [Aeromicrobium sp. PE09-221]|uniref:hypothetical protein n=1 Tax=Aeromicrobium sp. PE09-221 TaxID=1898043 RepID=UPI000B3E9600|nr:hypothetical protein [Aeromicrobium sp. PE09-221]OUZ11055.1 hypothetical protein BHE97_06400 [Aeromicrobium sp. PE09-221]
MTDFEIPSPVGNTVEGDASADCPVPLAHERFSEAHWFMHQMMTNYHTPLTFRFSANAFLSALKSVVDMLRLDLERAGQNEWRRARFEALKGDSVFAAFSHGRNIVLHQGALVQSSRVEVNLFKYNRRKLSFGWERKSDEPSANVLERVRATNLLFPDDRRPEGEQYVVRRIYYEPKLSADHDVLTASHIAWTVVGAFLRDAHNLLGFSFDDHDDEHSADHDVEHWWDYRETDAYPEILQQWGWA